MEKLEKVREECRDRWGEETETLYRLTKEEILLFNPRYILTQKPIGLSYMERDVFAVFNLPCWKYKGIVFPSTRMCVSVGDFSDVLDELPHIPNKKEGKALRKAKIKKGQ